MSLTSQKLNERGKSKQQKGELVKSIGKLIFVAILLFWAHRTYATTQYTYCDSNPYYTCMSQCYVPWVQATEFCPHGGSGTQYCYQEYFINSDGSYSASYQCFGAPNNSCIQQAAAILASCTENCGAEYCTTE